MDKFYYITFLLRLQLKSYNFHTENKNADKMRKPRFGRSSALSLMFKTIIVRILFNRRHNHIFSFRAYRSNHISLRLMKAVGRTALTGIRAYRKHHTAIRQCRSVSNPCRVCSNHTQERLSIPDVKAGLLRKVRAKQ